VFVVESGCKGYRGEVANPIISWKHWNLCILQKWP